MECLRRGVLHIEVEQEVIAARGTHHAVDHQTVAVDRHLASSQLRAVEQHLQLLVLHATPPAGGVHVLHHGLAGGKH